MSRTVRIAGASGFWGDSSIALPQLLEEPLEYITFDFLAEITMSIMARARAKDPEAGYAADFVEMMGRHAQQLARRKVRVIANAGGVNPQACARALEQRLAAEGVALKIGVVLGDDLLDRAPRWRAEGRKEMFSGAAVPEKLLSLNAYLGAEPVAAALAAGADVVITGRCVDSALTLGACLHEFGWSRQDLDARASGSLAGHITNAVRRRPAAFIPIGNRPATGPTSAIRSWRSSTMATSRCRSRAPAEDLCPSAPRPSSCCMKSATRPRTCCPMWFAISRT
jgi:Acyclic terpene utilisation family protein AtuA